MLKRVLPFVPLIFFLACVPPTGVSPKDSTAVVQTLTAAVQTPPSATIAPTHIPNTATIVKSLNDVIVGSNPLEETLDAKYAIVDVRFVLSANMTTIFMVSVECEWIYTNSCTPEKAFVILMRAIKNEETFGIIKEQIPIDVDTLQVNALEHMNHKGVIIIKWKDVVDYAKGKLDGSQLGPRITPAP